MQIKKKILHIITGLGDGGAEGVLFRLATFNDQNLHIVISLMGGGKYKQLLEEQNVEVFCLGLGRGTLSLQAFYRLYKLIKSIKPDVVQTWMYHADLIGGIISKLAGAKKIFWNIRHSELDPTKTKKTTIFIAKVLANMSHLLPAKIICCSQEALEVHVKVGYQRNNMTVIGNGYDLQKNKPLAEECINKLPIHLPAGKPLIGMVGRYALEKDHKNLFEAFSKSNAKDKATLLLAGTNMDINNYILTGLIAKYNLEEKVFLLGPLSDIPSFMNQIDIHVLSSSSEGFPNVLAEAMACGTPCVTTAAGAAPLIIGTTGWLVQTKNSIELSKALNEALLEIEESPSLWVLRKKESRKRIENKFSIKIMVDEYDEVWNLT